MTRPHNFDDVLSKLPGARQNGANWTAPCPLSGHKLPAGHLSLKDVGDKVLVQCQGGRHTYEEITAWLGFTSLNYNGTGGGYSSHGKACYRVITPRNQARISDNTTESR